ncbi:hypothetical protein PSE_2128 [Pseudovibrio sp. FO-BEG1]|nr:hypothetical protein PSE_2128 [Pseudovibrio sp. FO-BEG1]
MDYRDSPLAEALHGGAIRNVGDAVRGRTGDTVNTDNVVRGSESRDNGAPYAARTSGYDDFLHF